MYFVGLTNDLSHPGAPPSKPASAFTLLFGNKMENDVCVCHELLFSLIVLIPQRDNFVSDIFHLFLFLLKQNATKCFREELHTLNQSDPQKIREHKPFSPQIIKQKKGLSSRQAPFKSPSHLPVTIDGRKRNYGEQRGFHAYNTSPHPSDKDASCCLTKK